MKRTILITGHAGFIGFHLSKFFLETGVDVVGIDNLNDYYSRDLKIERQSILIKLAKKNNCNLYYFNQNLSDILNSPEFLEKFQFESIIHLAAQAGVRYSITNPRTYLENNINSFFEILEFARKSNLKIFYASTSSVYGESKIFPQSEETDSSHPVQFYAATKKSNELFAHAYSSIYKFQTIGLRFFTVYGPWGRPDMALYKFCEAFYNNNELDLYNNGLHVRSLTYIDDLIKIFNSIYEKTFLSKENYLIFNIGNPNSISLKQIVETLELKFNRKCKVKFMGLQAGDVFKTEVSMEKTSSFIENSIEFTSHDYGISKFVDWYLTQKISSKY